MGSYPSADLLYGTDLGLTEDSDWPWFTKELEEVHGDPDEALDHLLRGTGARYYTYGNLCSGYTGLALCTRHLHAMAYKTLPVDVDRLSGSVKDDVWALKAAWAVLYPDTAMPEPGWFIVVSYG